MLIVEGEFVKGIRHNKSSNQATQFT